MTQSFIKSILATGARVLLASLCALPGTSHLLAAACDKGGCRPAHAPHPAVARVIHAGFGSVCYGSGTLIDKDDHAGMLLTCAHLFRPGVGEVIVSFPSGERYQARVTAIDNAWDLAVLEIAPPTVSPVPVASSPPQPGERLQSCGYGPDGTYRCNQGQALGYVRTSATATYETLELAGAARWGDSGGPVFNAQGELAAVVWGTDGRTVEATACCRIRRFLEACRSRRDRALVPPSPPTQPLPERPAPNSLPAHSSPCEPSLPEMRAALGQFEAELAKLRGAIEQGAGRLARLEQVVSRESLVAAARAVLVDMTDPRDSPWTALVMPLLTALGWTGPPAVAAVLLARLGLAIARNRSRRARERGIAGVGAKGNSDSKLSSTPPLSHFPAASADPIVVRQESPPLPQQVVRERTFVPYQAPNLKLEALRWAQEEYVRRYPAARSMIETIENYAQQYESGRRGMREEGG